MRWAAIPERPPRSPPTRQPVFPGQGLCSWLPSASPRNLSVSRAGWPRRRPSPLRPLGHPVGIQGVPEGIPHKVEAQDREHDGQSGEDRVTTRR